MRSIFPDTRENISVSYSKYVKDMQNEIAINFLLYVKFSAKIIKIAKCVAILLMQFVEKTKKSIVDTIHVSNNTSLSNE